MANALTPLVAIRCDARRKDVLVRYAVLGAAGQLGRDLCPRLGGDVIPLGRDRADLTRPEELRSTLTDLKPDVVVNCAAYNFVDRAENETDSAFAVNAWGVWPLAKTCRDLGCTLAHFSTDYVFGLEVDRRTPYRETDTPEPLSVYGLSKLSGEYWVRAVCPRHFIIRTCGLYGVWGSGGKGGNFVETMLRLAGQGKPLRVVADQICTPTYTVDLATAAAALLQTDAFGIYHLTNAGSCSWHEFAAAIFAESGVAADLTPIPSRDYPTAARRPGYSVLDGEAYRTLGLPPLRPWREALAAYLQERKQKEPSARAGA
jgi:dTDP-4-dehydrorhamnose reductase